MYFLTLKWAKIILIFLQTGGSENDSQLTYCSAPSAWISIIYSQTLKSSDVQLLCPVQDLSVCSENRST